MKLNEIKHDSKIGLKVFCYITWEQALEAVCVLAAQHCNDNVFIPFDVVRLENAIKKIKNGFNLK